MISDVEKTSDLHADMDDHLKLWMDDDLWDRCEHFMPNPEDNACSDTIEAYRFLKFKLENLSSN